MRACGPVSRQLSRRASRPHLPIPSAPATVNSERPLSLARALSFAAMPAGTRRTEEVPFLARRDRRPRPVASENGGIRGGRRGGSFLSFPARSQQATLPSD